MAYKCLECGNIFDEGEERRWIEPHGEEMTGCPFCNGAYEKTVKCEFCEGEFLEDELFGGVCQECIDGYKYDVETSMAIGDGEKLMIEINGFLAHIFSEREIESILYGAIKEKEKLFGAVDCSSYAYEDLFGFGENLLKEVKHNEQKRRY